MASQSVQLAKTRQRKVHVVFVNRLDMIRLDFIRSDSALLIPNWETRLLQHLKKLLKNRHKLHSTYTNYTVITNT